MCYTIPIGAAIITTIIWKRRKELRVWWLNLALYGGALFGIIDHLWHGELFLISENIAEDLSLGCAITATIFACWGVVLALAKISPTLASYLAAHQSIGK